MAFATVVALLAVVVALVANLITLAMGIFGQIRQDRRARWDETWRQTSEKRERLRPHFERALRGAFNLQALSGLEHYRPPSMLSDDERKRLGDILDQVYDELQTADVALRLEGQSDAIEELTKLAFSFRQFRRSLSLLDVGEGKAKYLEQADKAAEQVRGKADDLEKLLREALAELNPPGPEPPESAGLSKAWASFAAWLSK